MLCHCLRRCTSIKPTLAERLVFAGQTIMTIGMDERVILADPVLGAGLVLYIPISY